MTRLAACVLSIVTISFCGSAVWSQSVREDVVGNITRFEQDSVKADLANDISLYEKYLADDYTVGSSTGVFETKKEILGEMRDPQNNQIHAASIHDIRVRSYGNAAIATYTIRFKEMLHGQECSATAIGTDTFIKIDGHWELAATHHSAVSE